MKKLLFIMGLLLPAAMALAQRQTIDIVGIHQLVDESISENKLQVAARNKQAAATATEQANAGLMGTLKSIYRQLQARFNLMAAALGLAQTGIYAAPMVSRILDNQQHIIQLAASNPALAAIGVQYGLNFAERAQSLLGYVLAISQTLGDLCQMKAADRKMLFDEIIAELSRLQELSSAMLRIMQHASASALISASDPFQDFVNADRAMASNIIQNARYLK